MTSSHSAAWRRLRSTTSSRSARVEPDAVELESGCDVVFDRHGRERRRLLEDHPDSPPHLHGIDSGRVDILAVEQHLALGMRSRHDLVHPVEASHESRFAASGGPDYRGHDVGREVQVDRLDAAHLAEERRQISSYEFVRHRVNEPPWPLRPSPILRPAPAQVRGRSGPARPPRPGAANHETAKSHRYRPGR